MSSRKASIIINPRDGANLAKLPGVLAVFAAAGWKTEIAIKEYRGHTLKLAYRAAKQGKDMLVAYGGDGTLNQVVNGAMLANYQGAIAVLPGGTANVWATEVGIPLDPVKAALAITDGTARMVDIGHLAVSGITFPAALQASEEEKHRHPKKTERQQNKPSLKTRQHFLLMAGLGIDAAVMNNVSKPLKYQLGAVAVGLAAVKELPAQRPFPVEMSTPEQGSQGQILWKGEALQVVIGNTRLYAAAASMTPNAVIDDGRLDVCVITAGDPLSTFQQVFSLLLRRVPAQVTAEYFQGAHLSISVPASVPLQVDGSAVKLKDYLCSSDHERVQRKGSGAEAMVTYRFEALPTALSLTIPRTYDDALFQPPPGSETKPDQAPKPGEASQEYALSLQEQEAVPDEQVAQHSAAESTLVKTLLEQGRTVNVIAVRPNRGRQHPSYILAGNVGGVKPVAVCVDAQTTLVTRSGEGASLANMPGLEEGRQIQVIGKQNKRGVIRATALLL